VRFEVTWLAARGPYDEAALDPVAVEMIRAWGAGLEREYAPVVVDLGSGTGAALGRANRWLAPRQTVAYAVDRDPSLLLRGPVDRAPSNGRVRGAVPIVADLLEPLEGRGGPPDGSVDLVVGHALADLVPLDQLAARAFALARPGGLVHIALAYDGLTAFAPIPDRALEDAVLAAFHGHMDRPAIDVPSYGGSTAGRRLAPALSAAGLEVLTDAPSTWRVCASAGGSGQRVLSRLVRYVVEAAREIGGVPAGDLAWWEEQRRRAIAAGTLTVRVGHRDVLARRR
jgi:SAM-dependent methyltransferase